MEQRNKSHRSLATGRRLVARAGDSFERTELPRGELGAQIFEGVLRHLEAEVDAQGWDQPALLFAVSTPAAVSADLAAPVLRDLVESGPMQGTEVGLAAVAVRWIGALDGHPLETLWGLNAPADAAALVLVTEAWATSPVGSSGRGDAQPNRREVRMATAVTRDGRRYVLQRFRGEQPEFTVQCPGGPTGLVDDVLTRVMGASVEPSRFRPSHVLGGEVLELVAGMAACADRKFDLSRLPERCRAYVAQLRDSVPDMDPVSPEEGLADLLLVTALDAIAAVAAEVTGHTADQELQTLLDTRWEDWLSPSEALLQIRMATAALTWAELGNSFLSAVLPEQVKNGLGWAGESLAGRRADYSLGLDAAQTAAALAAWTDEETVLPILGLLDALGWLGDAFDRSWETSEPPPWADWSL